MFTRDPTPPLSDFDFQVFAMVVPPDHYLRQVASHIDFESFRPRLAEAHSVNLGRPPIAPVRMLKILYLRFHYQLSDRQVMVRTQTDMALRWFLGLPLQGAAPHHTDGTYFRQRIGAERFAAVLQDLIGQARAAGLVQDRLRLKDATHLLADVANVRPLQLAAQVRERLLQAASTLFAEWVAEQRRQIETLRQTTAEFADDERWAARLEHLRDMASQLRQRLAALPVTPATPTAHTRLRRAVDVVDKLLADREPAAQDRLVSGVDPEARVGKHGDYFVGYLLDMTIDADSELITNLHVLPANGAAEAADAVLLSAEEEAAQGNDVAALSMDGAGFNGPVLRELTEPTGLNLDVIVPPPTPAPRTTFGPERFPLTSSDSPAGEVTCPAGQTTRQRSRTRQDTGYRYQFTSSQWAACPLRSQCLENPAPKRGRVVVKNDYEAEYHKVRDKAQTPQYQETRRLHPKIERKLGEVVRHHRARRTSFRELPKVWTQAVLTALAVNIKRMVKVLQRTVPKPPATEIVRAELGWT